MSTLSLDDLPLATRELEIGGQRIRVVAAMDQTSLLVATEAEPQLPFGLLLWESALPLAALLAGRDLRGKAVLELGAGVGLPGISAALGGARVTQIDVDPLAIALGRRNALDNGVTIESRMVDWNDCQFEQRFDFIVGADVVYDTSEHAAVVALIGNALAPGGLAVFTDPNRLATVAFLTLLEDQGWAISTTEHRTADLTFSTQTVDVRMMQITRGA